ncbi:MAG: hypothetical protein JWN12_259 [Candidatus Saccharibacteria bacterium]|nr:hypothetical protein [Candidatus Saccharibacteria bacterium]
MKYKVRSWLLAVVVLSVSAVMPTHAAPSPERSLGISPLRNELTISPGTSFDGRLTLTNSGKSTLSVTMDAEVFSVTDEAYNYSFDPAGKGVDWVSFGDTSVTIDPGKSTTISYKVAVPIDSEPGGRYVSLFASSSPTTAASGVISINRVASLLYITVAGDVTRTGKVLTFNSPLLAFGNPTWTAALQNSGSTHFHSLYSVSVTSLFGGSALTSTQGDSLILPSSVRLLSQVIPYPQWLGIYRLDYTIGLGDVPAQQETKWILYLPPVQSLLILGILVGLFFLRPKQKKKSTPKHED